MALLVLRRVGLCVGQNQMCHLCSWLKLFLKNVRWGKIKIQQRWLLGRLSDGSFVHSLYVYFCRSFLQCRLLGLQVTFSGLAWKAMLMRFTVSLQQRYEKVLNCKTYTSPAFYAKHVLLAGGISWFTKHTKVSTCKLRAVAYCTD
jgi:hypothetical protein